jgi:cell division septum initiation protein DivIVA
VDVEGYLDELERLVRDARPVPLSASVMIGRQEAERTIAGLREQLPDELRQSRWVLKERDEVLDQAQREADQILADARNAADRMVGEADIVAQARRQAEDILGEAREQAKVLRLEAEDYVDSKLANFEIALQKILQSVEKGRERLRGRLASDELAEASGADNAAAIRAELYDYEDER